MRLCPRPIFIFDISLVYVLFVNVTNEQKSLSLPSELQVGHSHYF